MRIPAELGLLAFVIVAVIAGGAPARADMDTPDCDRRTTTMDAQLCADRDYGAADGVLNATYRKVSAMLDADTRRLLVDAQRAWVVFRDKECASITYEGRDGSGESILRLECLTRLTKARTDDLRRMME
jgi:uncharacterized protein YecT (DUF1311 family)